MGFSALALIGLQCTLLLLEVFEIFPYFRTLFFPAFIFMAGMIGLVGFFERDEHKTLSLIAMIAAAALFGWWIVMLVLRLQAA